MFVILLGAPGSGKGTIGNIISKEYSIPTISTGDILRENIKNNTELGKLAKSLIDNGNFVPDDIIINLVKDRVSQEDCKNGCIFDGFPRTLVQAEKLNEFLKVDSVILIDVEKQVIVDRILSRRTCPDCKKIFSTKTYSKTTCDVCGAKLVTRADDTKQTIETRYSTYEEQTKPLIKYYQDKNMLSKVDGDNAPEKVFESVKNILESKDKTNDL